MGVQRAAVILKGKRKGRTIRTIWSGGLIKRRELSVLGALSNSITIIVLSKINYSLVF